MFQSQLNICALKSCPYCLLHIVKLQSEILVVLPQTEDNLGNFDV